MIYINFQPFSIYKSPCFATKVPVLQQIITASTSLELITWFTDFKEDVLQLKYSLQWSKKAESISYPLLI